MVKSVQPQTVYIVDDDATVRDALCLLMDSVSLTTRSFHSADEFLASYTGNPGVLLLDVRMPGMSGLELQEELNKRGVTKLAIIFMSGHGDIPMVVEALKRGAADFLTKPFRDQDLLDRIHRALEQNQECLAQTSGAEEILSHIDSLTPREREVMAMVADGKANKVIAIELDISQRTVEIHRSRVMKKMGCPSLAHLVRALDKVDYLADDSVTEHGGAQSHKEGVSL
jgi:FixJ family two-component response regulator